MALINLLKNIKALISNQLLEVANRKQLVKFNSETNNYIYSADVDLNAIAGENITIQKGSHIDRSTKIGSYTFIGFNTRITKTTIGKYCSIANNVNIGDGEHSLENISTSSFFTKNDFEELTKAPCIIGNDVWIGVSSIIRRGVTIGDGAVIGANSFVNKDVESFTIVAGSPARVIRKRFSDEKISQIIASKWWDLSPENATQKIREIE